MGAPCYAAALTNQEREPRPSSVGTGSKRVKAQAPLSHGIAQGET